MSSIKESFAKILICIAAINGEIAEEEKSRITELYGIDEDRLNVIVDEALNNDSSLFDAIDIVSQSQEKADFLNDIIMICYSDGKYQKDERIAVKNLCGLLDISEEELTKAEKNIAIENAKKKVNGVFSHFENKEELKKGFKRFAEGTKKTAKSVGDKITGSTKSVTASVSNGLGALNTRVSFAIASAKKTKQENEALRAELKSNALSETVKQSIIKKLNTKISSLKAQLEIEKQRNDENEEIIALLQMQIDDLKQTRDVAENIKTA